MKLLLLLLAVVTVSSAVHDGDIFSIYNLKEILASDELRNEAFGCLMDRNPCGHYQLIRDRGPNILRTGCADCTPKQKATFDELFEAFKIEHNDDYKDMLARYAP